MFEIKFYAFCNLIWFHIQFFCLQFAVLLSVNYCNCSLYFFFCLWHSWPLICQQNCISLHLFLLATGIVKGIKSQKVVITDCIWGMTVKCQINKIQRDIFIPLQRNHSMVKTERRINVSSTFFFTCSDLFSLLWKFFSCNYCSQEWHKLIPKDKQI